MERETGLESPSHPLARTQPVTLSPDCTVIDGNDAYFADTCPQCMGTRQVADRSAVADDGALRSCPGCRGTGVVAVLTPPQHR